MNRYRDFDEFIKEQEQVPVTFKMFNKTWTLPAKMPVKIVLRAINAGKSGDDGEAFEILNVLLGEEQFSELMDLGIDLETLNALLPWVMEVYTGTIKSDNQVGK